MAVVSTDATTATTRQPGTVTVWARSRQILTGFLARRILRAILTIFFVTTFIFFLVRLLPGNPIEVYINQQITQYGYSYEDARAQAQSLFAIDVDQPVLLQYFDYLQNLAQGNLGMSVSSPGTTVGEVIESRLPWTLFSVGTALVISFIVGALLGMFMAYERGRFADSVLSSFASLSGSIPNFLGALLLLIFFGVKLEWIPFVDMRGSLSPGQQVEFSFAFVQDALYHATLPILVYVVFSIGSWMLLMKSSTISTLEEDYVAAGRARGVPEWRIAIFYVGRNAILPLFTQLTIAIGFVAGGSLLIEPIFAYEGIGSELWRSIQQRDYPMLQGIFLVVTVSVVVANLIADLFYSRLDPRIRTGGGE
ncbi:MAG TPA: ABC transporter permease [Thermomicrobiales bacterium]|nr:ABC transporter permease [Thermomicrobiales bacterium]